MNAKIQRWLRLNLPAINIIRLWHVYPLLTFTTCMVDLAYHYFNVYEGVCILFFSFTVHYLFPLPFDSHVRITRFCCFFFYYYFFIFSFFFSLCALYLTIHYYSFSLFALFYQTVFSPPPFPPLSPDRLTLDTENKMVFVPNTLSLSYTYARLTVNLVWALRNGRAYQSFTVVVETNAK